MKVIGHKHLHHFLQESNVTVMNSYEKNMKFGSSYMYEISYKPLHMIIFLIFKLVIVEQFLYILTIKLYY